MTQKSRIFEVDLIAVAGSVSRIQWAWVEIELDLRLIKHRRKDPRIDGVVRMSFAALTCRVLTAFVSSSRSRKIPLSLTDRLTAQGSEFLRVGIRAIVVWWLAREFVSVELTALWVDRPASSFRWL